MKTLGRLSRIAIGLSGAGIATLLALAPSAAATPACKLSIPSYGCTISSPGSYTLTGSSPMLSPGACIDITASDVTPTGGPQINGPEGFVMENGQAVQDSGVRIELNGAHGAFLEDITTIGNARFGIWLSNAANNHIGGFVAEGNNVAGVYLECNPGGEFHTECPPGALTSSGNTIIGSLYGGRASLVNRDDGLVFNPSQAYGVAVGLGNTHNHFLGIAGDGNSIEDALDENLKCGSNRWLSDTFAVSSPAQGTTPFCLN